ncbi:MAG: hypothetical protein A2Y67_00055 [Candidatus Buchananbacteria bacterium RBG_13_39_9]|uniref:DUF4340 domain-containing protein n=1 Tax=Candidatus Buchananbacteria bacterium RBG_13_39_9 TaxID=1797531 RepID=A0A1G1XRZ0_9BACT|nr:MAG: hypothetical protein A2Y67_00055 [Candidatus Buchananbacteria bacterium RBG_13_39_9]
MSPKSKSLLIFLIILAALTVIYFFWQNPLAQKSNKILSEQIYNASLDNVQKIEITLTGQTTILEKPAEGGSASGGQNDKWVISSQDNAEANASLIENLITGLKDSKTGTVVSQNQEKLASFNLTEDKAIKLKLSDNQNTILEILIGKMGPSYTDTYIKKINSNNVLLVSQNLNSLVNQPNWLKPAEQETNINSSQ